MFGDLGKFVRAFRGVSVPRPVTRLDDVKASPNDVILSYLIADGLRGEDLRQALKNPFAMNEWLSAYAIEQAQTRPFDRPLEDLSADIAQARQVFAFGAGDMLLVARADPVVYHAAGRTIRYARLTDETCANVSIFDMGYTVDGRIGIRENAIEMIDALGQAMREDPALMKYRAMLPRLRGDVERIVLAHELAEQEILKDRDAPYAEALELRSESEAQIWRERFGVPKGSYELYHLLRAGQHSERGKNISRLVVESGFRF